MTMSTSSFIQVHSDSKLNIKISLKILKENWKAFVFTELFAIIAVLFLFFGFKTVGFLFTSLFPSIAETDFFTKEIFILTRSMMMIIFLLFLAFLTSQYGLAYDVLTSGDMFAEFKGAFIYFKRHWFAYSIITFFLYSLLIATHSIFFFEFRPDSSVGFNEEHLVNIPALIYPLIIVIYIFVFILFSNVLPSLTAQKNLKNSFSENFKIFKSNYRILYYNWGMFLIIFQLPTWIIAFIGFSIYDSMVGSIWWTILSILFIISYIYSIMLGTPMMTIMATRIYNDYMDKNIENLDKKEQINRFK